MPPKIKTDRNSIITAAFEVAKNEGLLAITAQRVSSVLNTSVAPIFREFQTIEELRKATMDRINEFHMQYIQNYPAIDSTFLTYGIAYIHFAKQYPYLFETIMQPGEKTMDNRMSGSLSFLVNGVVDESGLSFERAKELFFNIWVYTHGIACLVYKGSLNMTDEEVKKLLLDAFIAFRKK